MRHACFDHHVPSKKRRGHGCDEAQCREPERHKRAHGAKEPNECERSKEIAAQLERGLVWIAESMSWEIEAKPYADANEKVCAGEKRQ